MTTGLHVVESGAGGTRVILVHGAMDRGSSFAAVADLLPELRIVRYDRRGYGESRHLGVTGLAGHVADLVELTDGVPVVAIGHSVGAAVLLQAAVVFPSAFAALGVFEMPMGWAPWWPEETAATAALRAAASGGTDAAGEGFVRRLWGEKGWNRLSPEERDTRRIEGAALVAEVKDMRSNELVTAAELAALEMPVRVARGAGSPDYHRRGAEELACAIGQRPLDELPDTGHGAHVANPKAFAEWVRSVCALRG